MRSEIQRQLPSGPLNRPTAITKTPAKIVFVNRFFFPDESATAQILTDLAVHIQKQGAKVSVITGRYSLAGANEMASRETVSGIDVRRVRSARWGGRSLVGKVVQFATFYPAAFVELLKVVRRGDLIIAKTDPPLISVVAWGAARLRRAHLINWLQDLYPEVASELRTPFLPPLFVSILRSLRNASLRAAATNVVIGDVMASKLEGEGLPRQSIDVIHNWADEQLLRPIEAGRSIIRQEWGLAPDEFVLAYSGNLGRAHEFDTLLEAASRVADRPNIKFLFVGSGFELDRLKSKASDLGLTNFLFRPHQPRERLQESLAAGDAHWLSLRPELEGLIVPSKLYGILAAGRPVISVTAADGEVARIVRRNVCGYHVAPGDAAGLARVILELADNPELRAELGQRARDASEKLFAKGSALDAWTGIIEAQQSSCLCYAPRSAVRGGSSDPARKSSLYLPAKTTIP